MKKIHLTNPLILLLAWSMPLRDDYFRGKPFLVITNRRQKWIYFLMKGVQCFLRIKFVSSTVLFVFYHVCVISVLNFQCIITLFFSCFPRLNDHCESSVFFAIVWSEHVCCMCSVIHVEAVLIQINNLYLILIFSGLNAWHHKVLSVLL